MNPVYNLKVNIQKNAKWQRGWVQQCHIILQKAYDNLTIDRPMRAEISVLLTNDTEMRRLNFQFLGHDYATNVLSFPANFYAQPRGVKFLGDMALGLEIINQESLEMGRSFSFHTHHLLIHGLLHILGYDHENDADANAMESEEIRILHECFTIPNPYKDYD